MTNTRIKISREGLEKIIQPKAHDDDKLLLLLFLWRPIIIVCSRKIWNNFNELSNWVLKINNRKKKKHSRAIKVWMFIDNIDNEYIIIKDSHTIINQ